MKDKIQHSFPGMENFKPKDAQKIGRLIHRLSESTPSAVRKTTQRRGFGFTAKGDLDPQVGLTLKNAIEMRNSMVVAKVTARTLGGRLTAGEILDMALQTQGSSEKIPVLVYQNLKKQ